MEKKKKTRGAIGLLATEFVKAHPERARELYELREKLGDGISFRQLEEKFGLKQASGMSAYRVYRYMQDGKQPRAQGVTNQTFTLDTETVARLDDIAKAWGMNKSAVIRKLVSNVVIVKPDA